MDIDNAFADPEIEREGTWVDYRDGSRIKIARIGNPNFTRSQDAMFKAHRKKQRAGNLESELETSLLCQVIAKTVLLDWEGFEQGGKPFKYSQERAANLLNQSIDFRNDVVEYASTEEIFHREIVEDSEKN